MFTVAWVIWDRFHPTGDIGPVRLCGYHQPTVLKGFHHPLLFIVAFFVSVGRQSNVWFGDSSVMWNIVAVNGFEHGCENAAISQSINWGQAVQSFEVVILILTHCFGPSHKTAISQLLLVQFWSSRSHFVATEQLDKTASQKASQCNHYTTINKPQHINNHILAPRRPIKVFDTSNRSSQSALSNHIQTLGIGAIPIKTPQIENNTIKASL